MRTTGYRLTAEAKLLPPDERREIVDRLLASVDEPIGFFDQEAARECAGKLRRRRQVASHSDILNETPKIVGGGGVKRIGGFRLILGLFKRVFRKVLNKRVGGNDV